MKNFIVITNDGYTEDNKDNPTNNCQVLDFIKAPNMEAANSIYLDKKIDNFEDFTIYEILNSF